MTPLIEQSDGTIRLTDEDGDELTIGERAPGPDQVYFQLYVRAVQVPRSLAIDFLRQAATMLEKLE